MVGGLSQGGISRVRANHLLTAILTAEVSFGSNCDLQRPLEYRRFSARNETFGTERPESARKMVYRGGCA